MHAMLSSAIKIAQKAGEMLVKAQDRLDQVTVFTKDENDCVSDVDRKVEAFIIESILDAYPQHAILAEESGDTGHNAEFRWIIDPLDGTRNFIQGIPHYCISMALEHQGKLLVGVVYDPVRDECFSAERGKGARLNNKRLRVSDKTKLSEAVLGTGFPYRPNQCLDTYLATLKTLLPACAGLRRPGAAALDLAYVAAGRFDGFWEMGLKRWDMAAGVLLIREAGGLISDWDGGETYLETGNIVTANRKLLKTLMPALIKSQNVPIQE